MGRRSNRGPIHRPSRRMVLLILFRQRLLRARLQLRTGRRALAKLDWAMGKKSGESNSSGQCDLEMSRPWQHCAARERTLLAAVSRLLDKGFRLSRARGAAGRSQIWHKRLADD